MHISTRERPVVLRSSRTADPAQPNFRQEPHVLGSTSGSPAHRLLTAQRLRPIESPNLPVARAIEGFRLMERGVVRGKVVFHRPSGEASTPR